MITFHKFAAAAAVVALLSTGAFAATKPEPVPVPPVAAAKGVPIPPVGAANTKGATVPTPLVAGSKAPREKVNVNDPRSDLADFDKLFGVGDAYAAAIKNARGTKPFKNDIDDFAARTGLPKTTVQGFWDQVVFADVNNACFEDLKASLGNVGVVTARSIVEHRGDNGYKDPADLTSRTTIAGKTASDLAPHLAFSPIESKKPWVCLSE